jgi:hypothetical protein
MRSLSVLIALLALGVGAPLHAWAQTWLTYESEAGHFRVDMPGKPEVSQPTSKNGNTQTAAMVLTTSAAYLVTFADAPAGSHGVLPPAELIEKIRDAQAQGHKLLRDKQIAIAGNPGREYVIARTDKQVQVVRTTIVSKRLYQVLYAAEGQTEPTSPDVQRFFDSFALK